MVHKDRFSMNLLFLVPKRPETAFSDKNCFFCFVSSQTIDFLSIQVFLSCVVLKRFLQGFALEIVFAKEQLCFLARLVQQQSVERVGVIWRLIGETVVERACVLASVSPEGQFRSKVFVLFSVWVGKTHSFTDGSKNLLVVAVWATRDSL